FLEQCEVALRQKEFGGEETWGRVASQLENWGCTSLPEQVFNTLAATPEGIRAMYAMMRNAEPDLIDAGIGDQTGLSEAILSDMVRDPRYWRDRDPDFIAKVTAGFKDLYAA
ncbi:MAG: hypothetical protein AAFY56_20190, partial [Pseudomonadota bacterium]